MPAIYSAPPQKADYEHVAGDTFDSGTRTLLDALDAPYNISAATGEVKLRDSGGVVVATGTWALLTDGTDGSYVWSLPAATTEALPIGRYSYAERLTFGASVKTILTGHIQLFPSVVP